MPDGTGGSGASGRSPGRRRAVRAKARRKSFLLFSPVQLSPARWGVGGGMQKVPKETGLKDDGNTEGRRKRRERGASELS